VAGEEGEDHACQEGVEARHELQEADLGAPNLKEASLVAGEEGEADSPRKMVEGAVSRIPGVILMMIEGQNLNVSLTSTLEVQEVGVVEGLMDYTVDLNVKMPGD
jgi:hypothetical protein